MEYLKVWTSFREIIEPLTDAEKGRLFVAMLEYAESGIEPQLSGNERYVWPSARQGINNTRDRSEQMKANGSKPKQAESNRSKTKQNEANESSVKQTEAALFDKEKEKVKDNIYTTITTAHTREGFLSETEIDPLIVKVQQELSGLTDTHYQALNDYREELSDEVVSYAIDLAVGNGVRKWSYVESILRAWVTLHIKTLGEAKAESQKRKNQPQQRGGKVVSAQQYQQREYKESEMAAALGVNDLFKGDAAV